MRVLILLLAVSPLFAAIDGVVTNLTTGKPQPGAVVALYRLAQAEGMDHVETVKADAEGKFHIDREINGPSLLQSTWQGVSHNHIMPPGSPTTGIALIVTDASTQKGDAKIATHMMILEPSGSDLRVNESYVFNNTGKVSYEDSQNGTLQFYLPERAGEPHVTATAPQGMPIAQAAQKTGKPNVYKVDFPIKPGQTSIDVEYDVPMQDPGTFAGKILQTDVPTHIVAPPGVTLSGDGLEFVAVHPETQATVYRIPGKEFSLKVSGEGSLNGPQESQAAAEDEGQQLAAIKPFLYDRYLPILGLAFLVLTLGFILLYRKREPVAAAAAHAAPQASRKGKRR